MSVTTVIHKLTRPTTTRCARKAQAQTRVPPHMANRCRHSELLAFVLLCSIYDGELFLLREIFINGQVHLTTRRKASWVC